MRGSGIPIMTTVCKLPFARTMQLIKKGVVTQVQYDKAKAEADIAAAELKLAEQNLQLKPV